METHIFVPTPHVLHLLRGERVIARSEGCLEARWARGNEHFNMTQARLHYLRLRCLGYVPFFTIKTVQGDYLNGLLKSLAFQAEQTHRVTSFHAYISRWVNNCIFRYEYNTSMKTRRHCNMRLQLAISYVNHFLLLFGLTN